MNTIHLELLCKPVGDVDSNGICCDVGTVPGVGVDVDADANWCVCVCVCLQLWQFLLPHILPPATCE